MQISHIMHELQSFNSLYPQFQYRLHSELAFTELKELLKIRTQDCNNQTIKITLNTMPENVRESN